MSDQPEETRADILAAIKKIESKFKLYPKDNEIRFKYGELLYQAGEFWLARDIIKPLVESTEPSKEALSLAGELEYLLGNYAEAEKIFKRLIEKQAEDLNGQVKAMVGLLFTYYQTNQFIKAKELDFPPGIQLPFYEQMKVFDENPYQKEWQNPEKVSILPFLMTDPLPALTVEVNGMPIQMTFDTGGDEFVLDNEIAAEMGIEWIAKAMGTFGGGLQSEIGFGKVDHVKVGEVTLKQVPITILPTKRFSPDHENSQFTCGGIIGTAAMRQFLGTLDYKNGRLVLRERTKAHSHKLRQELKDQIAAELPFVLKATHWMMARGSLNDKDGLTFFVDSGLGSEACMTAPIQTLHYTEIPVPETKIDEKSAGGGGVWASGFFPIKTITLGNLRQSDVKGEYGGLPPQSYWKSGFIQDGLISHQFLRQYASWTIDFDQMMYIFEK